ncbi:hypothetical protein [Oenococcus oeni]|uniref:hypothetical protein n=3 Tax=Oenococcus oeni TaxID=1247 RepID=UPI0011BABDE9|nr:hypothetical protein [Oenococcus oeni]
MPLRVVDVFTERAVLGCCRNYFAFLSIVYLHCKKDMLTMKLKVTLVFSIVTAATAIIGIFMTWWQIRNSNKQSLFEKRLQLFLFADGLANLLRETPTVLNEKDDIEMANDFDFLLLTNNAELSSITSVIKDAKDSDKHQVFLKELESFKGREQMAKFVFKDPTVDIVSSFIQVYCELLLSTYQYQILLDNMLDSSKRFGWDKEEAAQKLHENTYRSALNQKVDTLKQNCMCMNLMLHKKDLESN